jgi:hypothetical protein
VPPVCSVSARPRPGQPVRLGVRVTGSASGLSLHGRLRLTAAARAAAASRALRAQSVARCGRPAGRPAWPGAAPGPASRHRRARPAGSLAGFQVLHAAAGREPERGGPEPPPPAPPLPPLAWPVSACRTSKAKPETRGEW